jgi:heme-degrading monooxygenase HmoA
MVTALRAFALPPEDDGAFLAVWARCREVLAGTVGVSAPTLYRALRSDVAFRFVELTPVESEAAWDAASTDPACADGPASVARSGLYEVVREDGDVDAPGGATLIAVFEVPKDADAAFLERWTHAHAVRAPQQGHIGTRLHRSLRANALRYAEVTRWSSPLMHARAARRPEVQDAARGVTFPSHVALYQVAEV